MHILLFCTVTNQCTIISQIITPLHVSTLLSHPQRVRSQYLAKLHSMTNAAVYNTIYNQDVSHRFYASSHIIVVDISIL
jgi:hypothetical protein